MPLNEFHGLSWSKFDQSTRNTRVSRHAASLALNAKRRAGEGEEMSVLRMKWEMVEKTDGNNILDMHWERRNRAEIHACVIQVLRDLQDGKVA
jgi:1,4-alpha-glucan branching enzyme